MKIWSAKKRILALFILIFTTLVFFGVWGCTPQENEVIEEGSDETTQDSGDVTVSGQYDDEFTWTADVDCTICHAPESQSLTDTAVLAGFHANTEGLDCADCHADVAALEKAHKDKNASSKMPTRLRTTKVEDSFCLTCHDDYPVLAEQTASYTELVDKNGLVVNPHALPENSDHTTIRCATCHVMHENETPIDAAKAQCLSCHHENVFECGTCH